MNNKTLSVVIPCRNEVNYIAKCLESIISNEFDKNKLEVFVVDGMSDDNTQHVLQDYEKNYSFIRILSNEKQVTPIAMNIGIREAKGDYIIILSSHSEIDERFLKNSLEGFEKQDADCVGGTLTTLPANKTPLAGSIAFAISHPFGVGNSHFRIGTTEPRYVDTVPFGCYKKETLYRIGLFDEDLVRNQDDELNLRLIKNGGKILLDPSITSHYYARDSLMKLWRMYYQYGYFKPLVAQKVGGVRTWRQLIPVLFVISLLLLGALSFFSPYFFWLFAFTGLLYLAGNLIVTIFISVREGMEYLLFLPFAFATLHFSYGMGYLRGIWDFVLFEKQGKNKTKNVSLTR